jgi:hypothetical protein
MNKSLRQEEQKKHELQYWILARGEQDTPPERAVSDPWWPESCKWAYRCDVERVDAPLIFTTRERAEQALGPLREAERHDFLERLESIVDRTLHHYQTSLQAYGISLNSLIEKLESADFLCVRVDGELKLRRDFVEELKAVRVG